MALNFEFFEGADTATAEGVYIPIANLPGVVAGEFADIESVQKKESKLIYAVLNKIFSDGLASALGIALNTPTIVGQSGTLSSKAYTITAQYYADIENQVVNVLPVPTIGTQVGVGDVAMTDLFATSAKVAASGAVAGEGVVIPTALLVPYGSPAHASLNLAVDNRDYLIALIRYMISEADTRSATVASAITAKSIGAVVGLTLPAVAYDATNPTTGIEEAKLNKINTFSRAFNITIQRIENESAQTFDVNVVTA